MSRPVANVDVITDSFEIWLLETNELLHALSTEIITANSTYANTGNTAFPRTAQLYGTFGANNLVVKDWMKGGNVNGQFANLMISTNTVLSNTTATEIRLEVANGSSNSFIWQYGLHAGLTGANLVANTTKLTVQSNSTTNSTANATLIAVQNSTISANMTSNSFVTGISKVSNVEINVGANLIANSTALYVGNSSINSVHSQASSLLQNSIHSSSLTQERLLVGNSTINALANSTIIRIANSTSSANVDPISFKTGIFTGNTIAASVGANLIANSSALYIGNSTINAIHTQTSTVLQNSIHSATMTLTRFEVGNSTINALANSTIIRIANSTNTATINPISFSTGLYTANTIQISLGANVTANATNGGTIQVTGTATVGNTVANSSGVFVGNTLNSTEHTSVRFIAVEGSNTAFANARIISVSNTTNTATITPISFSTGLFTGNTIQVSVGANVYANATSVFVGNATFTTVVGNGSISGSANLTITPTSYLKIVGAMNVSSNATFANTLSVAGAANVLSTLGVTGAANVLSTLGVTGATTLANTIAVTGTASYANIVTFKTEHVVDVFANGNLGATVGSDLLVLQYPKADYSSAKLLIQIKNAGNTQISEALVAHDTTTAYITTYGTVSSPPASNAGVSLLGTFSANVDTTNVRVYVKQTRASSAAKVVAQFIK